MANFDLASGLGQRTFLYCKKLLTVQTTNFEIFYLCKTIFKAKRISKMENFWNGRFLVEICRIMKQYWKMRQFWKLGEFCELGDFYFKGDFCCMGDFWLTSTWDIFPIFKPFLERNLFRKIFLLQDFLFNKLLSR